jgi:saccharopine dehydrogenase-like NADP-dependent oxidoreductase
VHTVLVLGGYGFFGSRIAAALAHDPAVRLLVAGRNHVRAIAAAQALGLGAQAAARLDARNPALGVRLRELGVGTLIHTAGPFQQQGYLVAEQAIAAGWHYVDLADGREFVTGITALDARARARTLTVVSGASSVPALSSAVIERYRPLFREVTAIRIGISSGARAPGLATVRGIFSYCGRPFTCWENGAWTTAHGWLGLEQHRFPAPVGRRWLGRCNVPDLQLFPERYPHVRSVSFHAGFGSGAGHLLVWTLARLVKAGVLSGAAGCAPALSRLSRWFEPLASPSGAMFVRLEGVTPDGRAKRMTWNLLAGRNHGPQIPCGAAIALARKLARGAPLPAGALACVGLLSVEEILAPLRGLDIREVLE